MSRTKTNIINYEAKRLQLETKKASLETRILNTTDPEALVLVRADYRAITVELSLFYDDDFKGTHA